MRSRLRTIILVAAVLAVLSLVEGFHASAGATTGANASTRADGPQATAAKAWTFSGKGAKKLGTFRLRRTATLRWKSSGGQFLIADSRGFRLLYTKARRGKLKISSGTYRRLSLSARGSWKITIRERR